MSTTALARDARIALFHFNGLGDHVLAWPAVRAICRSYPAQVVLLQGPGQQFTLYQDLPQLVRRDVVFGNVAQREIDVERTMNGVGSCDVFLSLAFWVNPSLLALAQQMGARRVIGRYFPFREHVAPHPRAHMFEQYFGIAQHICPTARFDDHTQSPVCSPEATAAARDQLSRLRTRYRRLLFIHPETAPAKMWTAHGLEATLREFLERHPEYGAIVVSARNYPLKLDGLRERVLCLQPHFELGMALLLEADLFLGVDSVFMHLADLAQLPGVSLFGPRSDPVLWGYGLARGQVLQADPLSAIEPLAVASALHEASLYEAS